MVEEKLIAPGAAIGRLPNLRHEGRGAELPYIIIIMVGENCRQEQDIDKSFIACKSLIVFADAKASNRMGASSLNGVPLFLNKKNRGHCAFLRDANYLSEPLPQLLHHF